jgi:hypothetical protein
VDGALPSLRTLERREMSATQNDAHAATVEEIVGTIFDALPTDDSKTEGGIGSFRELAELDLKDLSPQEMAQEFRAVTDFIEEPVPPR